MAGGVDLGETLRAVATENQGSTLLEDIRNWLRRPPGMVPVIGSGLCPFAGLPTWSDFLRKLAARYGLPAAEADAALQVGDFDRLRESIEGQIGVGVLRRLVREEFADGDPSPAHDLVVSLTDGPIITTNDDKLLELAAARSGKPFDRVIVGSQSVRIDSGRRDLIRLESRTNIQLPSSGHPSFLFLGHSTRPQDPVFRSLLATLSIAVHYALLPKRERQYEEFLSSIGVRPVWYPEPADHLMNLLHYLADARIRTQPVQHALVFDERGRALYLPLIEYAPARISVGTDGLADVIARPLVRTRKSQLLDHIEDLEGLLNSDRTAESDLQEFFERHPEFLLGVEYDRLHPHITLGHHDGNDLRPDFILEPLAGVSHDARIIDLKLPGQPIIKRKKNRDGVYAPIMEGVHQLRTYARYFYEQANRDRLAQTLGFHAYRPSLTLIVGRSLPRMDGAAKADILDQLHPIELRTYEDVLKRAQRLADLVD